MKIMENTLENKVIFLRTCIGEYIWEDDISEMKTWLIHSVDKSNKVYLCHTKDDTPVEIPEETIMKIKVSKKPLSQISDEDAIKVFKILGLGLFSENYENTIWLTESFLSNKWSHKTASVCEALDYLRSKRYILPFYGLSVEKQINYNWIKLKP